MAKTISEMAAEQQAQQQMYRRPNAAPPVDPKTQYPELGSYAKEGSFGRALADQYKRGNQFAGLKPSDEIAGEYLRGNYGRASYNLLTGRPGVAAARELLSGPRGSYMGGSKEALEANRQQYDLGILSGQDQNARGEGVTMAGADMANTAALMAGGTYGQASGLAVRGAEIGNQGLAQQGNALGQSLQTAARDVGSQARFMQQAATDANARQMQNMAASARGGNAAAAMRNASAQASANQLQVNNQLAQARVQEEIAKRDALTQAQQFAAGQYGNNAQLGFNTAQAGLGQANAATGQANNAASSVIGAGGQLLSSGTQNTSTFVNAELAQNKAQLDADIEAAKAKQAHKAGILGMITNGAAMMGGGGGMGKMAAMAGSKK